MEGPIRRLGLLISLLVISSLPSVSAWKYLSHDWTRGQANLYSDLAKEMYRSQRVCKKKLWFGPANAGMGSDIHVWSQALCNAMHRGMSLVQPGRSGGDWIWADSKFCKYSGDRATQSRPFFKCYFNEGDTCSLSAEEEKHLVTRKDSKGLDSNSNFSTDCPSYVTDMDTRHKFRSASMEYLFSNVSRDLVAAADQAAAEVFHFRAVPRHKMITIHVRWGDKIREMKLVGVAEYMQALERVVAEHAIDTPFVYLTTETFEAYNAFSKAFNQDKYANWTLLNHRYSLAGKGDFSGYKERNPSQFPNFPSRSVTPGRSGDSLSYDNSTDRARQRMQKVRPRQGQGRSGKKKQLPHEPQKNGHKLLLKLKQQEEAQQQQAHQEAQQEAQPQRRLNVDLNLHLNAAPVIGDTRKDKFAKKDPRLSLDSVALGHAPSQAAHGIGDEASHLKGSKGKAKFRKQSPRNKPTSNRYRITPAVRAVSPMTLAKKKSNLGRHSLIALLIAMEAKHYILTTGSNWSRLINELRLNVLEARCRLERGQRRGNDEGDTQEGQDVVRREAGPCTTMLDLMKGDSPDWRK